MARLSDAQRAFVQDNPFVGTVTTLRADGSPHSTVVWVDTDGDARAVQHRARIVPRRKHVLRDPRVSVDRDRPAGPVPLGGRHRDGGADRRGCRRAHRQPGEEVPRCRQLSVPERRGAARDGQDHDRRRSTGSASTDVAGTPGQSPSCLGRDRSTGSSSSTPCGEPNSASLSRNGCAGNASGPEHAGARPDAARRAARARRRG